MKITVHGSGYVGLVSAACFANMGNDVLCVDVDKARVARLKRGEVPIVEPGLDHLMADGIKSGRLKFTDVPAEGVHFGLVQFIAVGTPPDEDGSADLRYVLQVAKTIGEHMDGEKIVVDKSTVPVGTADKVHDAIVAAQKARGTESPLRGGLESGVPQGRQRGGGLRPSGPDRGGRFRHPRRGSDAHAVCAFHPQP